MGAVETKKAADALLEASARLTRVTAARGPNPGGVLWEMRELARELDHPRRPACAQEEHDACGCAMASAVEVCNAAERLRAFSYAEFEYGGEG